MRQNQKGFTLIELLAVIVILAVIALIATPIILNVVSDARKKAAADSAYSTIKAVELAFSKALTTENPPTSLYVQFSTSDTKGYIIKEKSSDSSQLTGITVDISGTKPTAGSITIDSNGNVTVGTLTINGYSCAKSSGDKITCS
ncbi:MAG: prepilin-type N-terminal cleavage/methylation domain-containing protein [Bacilli bacterium]|nr:prepilin-type N-terminal cleavage/methylation domain-containing protein [Bacilli bacterium]